MDKEQKKLYKESEDKHFEIQSEAMQEQMKQSQKRSKKLNKGRKKTLMRRYKKCTGPK